MGNLGIQRADYIFIGGKNQQPHINEPGQSKPMFLQDQLYFLTKTSTYIVGAKYIYFNT